MSTAPGPDTGPAAAEAMAGRRRTHWFFYAAAAVYAVWLVLLATVAILQRAS